MPRVLIIDDDRAIAQLTSLWVQSGGFEATVAFDGASGLACAEANPPDAILLDIRMPDLDGFEVAARLRACPELAEVPIVFLSANVQEEARKEALAAGAVAFLAKPYEGDAVLAAVRKAVAARHTRNKESCHG